MVVVGGRRGRDEGVLLVEDGDLLELILRKTAEITPTPSGSEEGSQSSDDESGGDNLPSSETPSTPPEARGPGPFGPPPPRPVNEPAYGPKPVAAKGRWTGSGKPRRTRAPAPS